MKILLTGGGTGGHFYPIIAITEAIYDLAEEERLLQPKIILASDKKYSKQLTDKEELIFKKIYSGKVRNYFSLLSVFDFFKTILGVLKGIWIVYWSMPDVVFGKGGSVSFPILLAAKIFGIPVIIHESDSVPGKVNKWASKFAERIAISFPESSTYLPKGKTALTGTPVRKSLIGLNREEGVEAFDLEDNVPTILVLGGSQGSQKINDAVVDISKELVNSFQIIHQCGIKNIKDTEGRIKISLQESLFANRYHVLPYLNDSQMRNAASVANLVISRGGSGSIYEIATWGIPSIIIPLKNSAQDHQKENAYNYARTGAAKVIEEKNLLSQILISEINAILSNKEKQKEMSQAAKDFARTDSAKKIAKEILNLALAHQ
ncbi:MAG: undecaprenyldiphospho-muramoylpentapeptide beta-N-acetylglucosaminyltransferase [Candidatus Marinimicrobia bacterium]|nr:undecaprenyldiphospho-muramoylpentapeptide beta-N-acetylglucosaminyltransferase [Candidatus Neomarinimicrobiota bacterium]